MILVGKDRLCQIGKDVHEEGGYGASFESSIGERSRHGLHASSGSAIRFQSSSGSQPLHNTNMLLFFISFGFAMRIEKMKPARIKERMFFPFHMFHLLYNDAEV